MRQVNVDSRIYTSIMKMNGINKVGKLPGEIQQHMNIISGIVTCISRYGHGFIIGNNLGHIYIVKNQFDKLIYKHRVGITKILKVNNLIACVDEANCMFLLRFHLESSYQCELVMFWPLNSKTLVDNIYSYGSRIITIHSNEINIWDGTMKYNLIKKIDLTTKICTSILCKDHLIIGCIQYVDDIDAARDIRLPVRRIGPPMIPMLIRDQELIDKYNKPKEKSELASDIIIIKISLKDNYSMISTSYKQYMKADKKAILKLALF